MKVRRYFYLEPKTSKKFDALMKENGFTGMGKGEKFVEKLVSHYLLFLPLPLRNKIKKVILEFHK